MLEKYTRRFNPRAWSNDELRALSTNFPRGARVINVSGWQDLDKEGGAYRDYWPNPEIYHVSNYESDTARGANVHSDLVIDLAAPLPAQYAGFYEVAFNHTVLEHVEDPVFAFEQIAKLTTGIIVTIVPFKQKLHFEDGMYGDYYRFTPFSMRRLHAQNGFTLLYESYTPQPSLDVYLLYVGARDARCHPHFPKRIADLSTLNQRVGNFNAHDLMVNVAARFLGKYVL